MAMNKRMLYALITTFLVWLWTAVFWAVWVFTPPDAVRFDCSVAEFHPDFSSEARAKCRRLRQSA